MKITNCRVNHLRNPLGYEMKGDPVFSWITEEAEGKKQESARIRIFCGDELKADTGWADLNSLGTDVPMALAEATRYTWTVAVRSDAGEEAESEVQWFETGINEWTAPWIGCDDSELRHPVFSHEVSPAKEVISARLYICGLGLFEARWNGEKIGNEYLTPYCTNYNSWIQYLTYDVTDQLKRSGKLEVELGNGWYKGRFGFTHTDKAYYGDSWKLSADLRLQYADGTSERIVADDTWKVTRSNITFSNIYDGERRDDTLPALEPVSAVFVDSPKGEICARSSTPVTVRQVIPAQELILTPAGETVLDIGQILTGIFRLSVDEAEGTKVVLQFGEILQDGNFYRDNLRTAQARYEYVSDGHPHILEPKFTFYGYRFVKVENVPGLKKEDFEALVLHSELESTGYLETGHPLVNKLILNTRWGQRDNFLDVPTDCPQRDERMGWTGDAQVFCRTASYLYDTYAFYAKYLKDMYSEQKNRGGEVPNVIPQFGLDGSSSAWGDAACIMPMEIYRMYGDRTILEKQYASMTAWANYIEN